MLEEVAIALFMDSLASNGLLLAGVNSRWSNSSMAWLDSIVVVHYYSTVNTVIMHLLERDQ